MRLLGVAVALLLCAGVPAMAVTNGEGDLVANFEGDMSPAALPRGALAPVSVEVSGGIRNVTGNEAALPQLRQIAVAINSHGRLFDRGLPVCTAEQIEPATEDGARAQCGGAIVGSGHVTVQVRIPSQLPYLVQAKLLVFNGPRRDGRKLILAQAYAKSPPGAFILTFGVSRQRGTFGTVLSTTLPRSARRWAYLTHFDIKLHRIYSYRGRRRSYVSAACAAPPGFRSALFPLARATYGFASGKRLSLSVADTCRVAGS